MKFLKYLLYPFEMFFTFIADLFNNNPRVLVMKFLSICFFALTWFIAYRWEFKNWYVVAGFTVSGILSFLNALFAYMEDKEITFAKLKDFVGTAADVFKKIKE